MEYTVVNRERREAQPRLVEECPLCSSEMIAKCGDVFKYHRAHERRRNCDVRCEIESEWHRAWKDQFPLDWQEVVHRADDGEKHVADVKTEDAWVLEFQHSRIKPEERVSREALYKKLIWMLVGKLRPTYQLQFQGALEYATAPIRQLSSWAVTRAERQAAGPVC